MDAEERAVLEQRIREGWDSQDWTEAATIAIRGYGPEILGYLAASTRSTEDATEAFSIFCEDMWKGLPGFRWQATFRTWAYTLARHALSRQSRDPRRRVQQVAISDSPEIHELVQQVRTATLVHLRTEVKDKVAELRAQLEDDDRTLLILRVDRRMSWNAIARVMADDPEADEDEIKRLAATMRKRFERAKDRLRELVAKAKIVEDQSSS